MNKLAIILSFCAALFFSGCTKQVAGPQGDAGTPGSAGNLKQSVLSSVKVSSSAWSLTNNQWEFLIFVEAITDDVLKKGEVKVYLEKDAQWWALPFSGEKYIFTQCLLEKGIVRLRCSHAHGGTPVRPADANYRVVVFSSAK